MPSFVSAGSGTPGNGTATTGANPTVPVPVGNTITAGSFTVGSTYKILTVSTTDFTLIGSSANTVGTVFVATGVGTGSGTASEYPASSDLLILITTGTATPTTPTGWTSFSAQGAGQFITVLYKYAGYLEATSVAVTLAGTTSKSVMLWYTGAGGLELASTYSTGTSTAPTTGSQTTRVDNDEILSIYANVSGAARTFTPNGNAGISTLVNSATTTGVQGLLISSETKTPAGLTTARAATLSASSTWAGVSISVRNKLQLYYNGTGNWSSTTLWKQDSAGGAAFGPPGQNDDVWLTLFTGNITVAAAAVCNTFNTSGWAGTFAGTSTLSVYGNWHEDYTLPTYTYSGAVTFAGSSAPIDGNDIICYYGLQNNSVTFNAVGGKWFLGANLGSPSSTSKVLTLTAGSFNLNTRGAYFGTFVNTGTTERSLPGYGDMYLNGSATTVINVATTGLTTGANINYVISRLTAGAGTRTVTFGTGYTVSNAPSLSVYSAADTVSITATSLFTLSFTDSGLSATPSTISNTALTIYGSLAVNNPAVFTFTAGTNTWTFADTGGGQSLSTLGATLDFPITFNGVGGSWTIDTLLMTNAAGTAATKTLTLTAGTVTLFGQIICGSFSCTGTGVRTLDGSGGNAINVSNSNSTVIDFTTITNLTLQNGPRFVTNSLAGTNFTGTRTIVGNTGFTAANAPLLDVIGYNDTVSITGAWSYIGFYDGATSAPSTISNNALTLYGNITSPYLGLPLTLYVSSPTAANFTAGANTATFAGTITNLQILTSGKTLDFPLTFDGVGGGWILQDALTSPKTVTLTNGSLDLNNNNFTFGFFSSNNANTRNITSGTGQFYSPQSNAYIWRTDNGAGLTYIGTPTLNLTYASSAGTRLVINANSSGSGALALNLIVNGGSDIFQNGSGSWFNNVNFTGYSGPAQFGGNVIGNLTFPSGMTNSTVNALNFASTSSTRTITTNGITLDQPVSFNGVGGTWQLIGALTAGSTRTVTLTNGALDLNNNNFTCGYFSSNNSNTRSIAFGTGQIYLTGSAGTICAFASHTGYTVTGTPAFNATYSGSTGTRTINYGAAVSGGSATTAATFNISTGTDTVTFGSSYVNNLNFTGTPGFSGTFTNAVLNIVGNYTLSSGMTVGAGGSTTSFLPTTGTKTITTAGKTLDFPLAFNGGGGISQFQDALTQGSTRTFNFLAGTVQLKTGVTTVVGAFLTTGTTLKYLRSTSTGTQATLSQSSGTVTVTYLDIKDSAATGGATFDATAVTNVNSGNNTGWLGFELVLYTMQIGGGIQFGGGINILN